VSSTSTDIAGQKYSAIDKTETTTNLVAQDGETIVIGGLIREDKNKTKNGIPFLSQIPLIGNLFSYTENTTARTEIIILLTPHVVKNQKEVGDVTTDYVDRYKGITKDKDINEFIKERGKNETKNDKQKTDQFNLNKLN
jgi:general secretion pathway protein D